MDLNLIRKNLNKIDQKLVELIAQRQSYMPAVGKYKQKNNLPITQIKREQEIFEALKKLAKQKKVNPELIQKIFKLIITDAKQIQKQSLKKEKPNLKNKICKFCR